MFNLNPFAISGFFIVITYLPLSILIFLRGKTKLTKIYALHIFAVMWWGIGSFLMGINTNPTIAPPIWKFAYLGVLFIPVFFLHAILLLTHNQSKLLILYNYAQAIFFLSVILFHNAFNSCQLMFDSIYFNHNHPLYLYSFLSWTAIVSMAHYLLVKYYWQNSRISPQKQILYLLIGSAIGFLAGLTNFLPGLGINFYPIGNFFVPISTIILTYATLRYQLLDIEIVIKRSIVYSVLIAFISVVYLLTVVISEKFLQGFVGYKSIFISVTTAFFLGIILVPLRNKIQQFIDRLFFKGTQVEIAEQNELLRQEVAKTEKLKAVATLASGMAHEIKNPLTVIKTFSEFLPQKFEDKEFLKKFAPLLNHEAERINQLVHNLLDFAKPAPLKLKEIDIHRLLTDTLNFLDNQFVKNKIHVVCEFQTQEPVTLRVDPNQLKQAFLNLFLNAVDAMPEGGTLTVRTQLALKTLQITIQDTGGGIDSKDLPHLFDPFFTKKDSGTGLGLSITHGIIEQHGGRIWVESVVGEGAVFMVELPLGNECTSGGSGKPVIRD